MLDDLTGAIFTPDSPALRTAFICAVQSHNRYESSRFHIEPIIDVIDSNDPFRFTRQRKLLLHPVEAAAPPPCSDDSITWPLSICTTQSAFSWAEEYLLCSRRYLDLRSKLFFRTVGHSTCLCYTPALNWLSSTRPGHSQLRAPLHPPQHHRRILIITTTCWNSNRAFCTLSTTPFDTCDGLTLSICTIGRTVSTWFAFLHE